MVEHELVRQDKPWGLLLCLYRMHLSPISLSMTASLTLCALNPRWQRVDHGDELPRIDHPDLELHGEVQQLQKVAAQQTEDAEHLLSQPPAAAAAGVAAAAAARDQAAAIAPPTPPLGSTLKRVASVKAAAALGAADGDTQGGAVKDGKPKRQPMTGSSPVHLTVKDSILTENKDWGLKRHEGILNLCVVVLLATNLR